MAAFAVPLISAGVSALAGYFGNKNKSKQETSQNTSETATSNTTSSSLSNILSSLLETGKTRTVSGPQFSPAAQGFIDKLIGSYSNATAPVNLRPYAASQMQGINRASQMSSRALDSIMAARGLSTSPVAATGQVNLEADRIRNIVGLQQQIPLLQRQLNLQGLESARGMAALLPSLSPTETTGESVLSRIGEASETGSTISSGTMTGQRTMTGTGTTTGSSGGGVGGIFNVLAALMAANSANKATGTGGANQPGLAGILASLFGGGNS